MARNRNNIITDGYSGAIGKKVVLKRINGETFACKYPDMSRVKYNKKQVGYQNLFAKAVAHARAVMNDPIKREEYAQKIHNDKRKRGTSVYHSALKEFMALHSQKVSDSQVQITFLIYQALYQLNEREAQAVKYLIGQGKLTNAMYRQLTKISRITATRDLQLLVQKGIITAPETKGAGAVYKLTPLPEQTK